MSGSEQELSEGVLSALVARVTGSRRDVRARGTSAGGRIGWLRHVCWKQTGADPAGNIVFRENVYFKSPCRRSG